MSIHLSSKLRKSSDTLLLHWCPGCKQVHGLDLNRWKFNGDINYPTFSSIFPIKLLSLFYSEWNTNLL